MLKPPSHTIQMRGAVRIAWIEMLRSDAYLSFRNISALELLVHLYSERMGEMGDLYEEEGLPNEKVLVWSGLSREDALYLDRVDNKAKNRYIMANWIEEHVGWSEYALWSSPVPLTGQ